jgi:hypothetical protein
VMNSREHSEKRPAKQGPQAVIAEPNKIGVSTPYDFESKNLTAYGGLLPVAAMLEKLGFQLTVQRATRAMPMYQFVLAMVLAAYVGFSRLHHLRFVAREPMLTGILKVLRLPPQCTFWRFLASLHLGIARQLLEVQRRMRQRVWEAAHVRLAAVTLDTDTTVHTLFGNQMGELRNGDRPTGAQIARHLQSVFAALPPEVKTIQARADSGFYCWEAVQAYEGKDVQFVISARKTARLVEQLKAADWKRSPRTDAAGQCEFRYEPDGWGKAYRFLALRYQKKPTPRDVDEPEQYQLFDTPEYSYRVFVTNMKEPIDLLVWFYSQRGGAENLIKEANNDAGLAAHPSGRWVMNCNHFQLAMLAYNLNCWLMLFNREEETKVETLKHITLATARLRFLFVAAKIWRHAGRVGVSYSDHYAEQGIFCRLMQRLRRIATDGQRFAPVLATALTG